MNFTHRPGEVERKHDGIGEVGVGLLIQPEAAASQHWRHRLSEGTLLFLVNDPLVVHQTDPQSGGTRVTALVPRVPASPAAVSPTVLTGEVLEAADLQLEHSVTRRLGRT